MSCCAQVVELPEKVTYSAEAFVLGECLEMHDFICVTCERTVYNGEQWCTISKIITVISLWYIMISYEPRRSEDGNQTRLPHETLGTESTIPTADLPWVHGRLRKLSAAWLSLSIRLDMFFEIFHRSMLHRGYFTFIKSGRRLCRAQKCFSRLRCS